MVARLRRNCAEKLSISFSFDAKSTQTLTSSCSSSLLFEHSNSSRLLKQHLIKTSPPSVDLHLLWDCWRLLLFSKTNTSRRCQCSRLWFLHCRVWFCNNNPYHSLPCTIQVAKCKGASRCKNPVTHPLPRASQRVRLYWWRWWRCHLSNPNPTCFSCLSKESSKAKAPSWAPGAPFLQAALHVEIGTSHLRRAQGEE